MSKHDEEIIERLIPPRDWSIAFIGSDVLSW